MTGDKGGTGSSQDDGGRAWLVVKRWRRARTNGSGLSRTADGRRGSSTGAAAQAAMPEHDGVGRGASTAAAVAVGTSWSADIGSWSWAANIHRWATSATATTIGTAIVPCQVRGAIFPW